MDVLEAIRGRRSIRRFRSDPIPDPLVDALEQSLLEAPSAGNLQSRKFFLVFREETRKRLARAAYDQGFIAQAPLAVVCCADLAAARRYGDRGITLYCLQDVAAGVQNLLLAAHSLGLGTVWVGAFDEAEVSRILDLPDRLRPVAIVPVGYPDENPPHPGRVRRERAIVHVR